MQLSFDEIQDHKQFESLVVAYYENLSKTRTDTSDIRVKPSGVGADGGCDILVSTKEKDIMSEPFKRTWIIQCKFHNADISTDKIADINIPTLIHSHKAIGYLLVCKQKPTSKLTQLFDRLGKKCTFGYHYQILSGEQFLSLLVSPLKDNEPVIQQFFPKYYDYYIKNLQL
jgi:hypothetical protein